MTNNTAPTPPVTENTEETALSLDTVLTILRRYWFIIILAALAGGTAAYYLAGKQNYIYQKTASVLMRDAKTGSDVSSERIMAELNIDRINEQSGGRPQPQHILLAKKRFQGA